MWCLQMSLMDPNKAKREERTRRRNAGFTLRQVWVHRDDRKAFDEMVDRLPHNDRYQRPKKSRVVKMPGMTE